MFRAMMKAYPESLTLRNSTENTAVIRNQDQGRAIPGPLKGDFRACAHVSQDTRSHMSQWR